MALIYCLCFQSQSYQVEYSEFVSIGLLELENAKNNYDKSSINADFHLEMLLNYSNGMSSYTKKTNSSNNENYDDLETSILIIPEYFKNHNKNETIEFFKNYDPLLYGEDIIIEEKLPIYNWEITEIKENISGYNCKLAKTTGIIAGLSWHGLLMKLQ